MIKKNLNKDLINLQKFLSNKNNNKIILSESYPTNNYLNLDNIKSIYNDSILVNIIHKTYIDCHKKSYGSGELLYKHLTKNLENLDEYLNILEINDLYKILLNPINKEYIGFNKDLIDAYIKQIFTLGNNKTKEIVNFCIENCDINTIFVIKKSNNDKHKITFESGNRINFANCDIINSDGSLENVYIVPIDGFIESVAEINLFLESAASSKDNIIIFCRGAAEDVKSTIRLNQKRKTINLSFVSVPLDEKHVNTLKDIAVISNNDVISTHDGKEIRKINYKSFNKVEKIFFEKDDVIFIQTNKEYLNKHINYLKSKLIENEESSNSAMAEVFKNRLQIFNSSQTIIEIPESDMSLIEISDLNSFFKRFINILKFGSCKTDYGIYSERCIDVVNLSLNSLQNLLLNSNFIIDNSQF